MNSERLPSKLGQLPPDRDGRFTVIVHVQPGTDQAEAAGNHGDADENRLASQPINDQANEDLFDYPAGAFHAPKRQLELLSGQANRCNHVRFEGAKKRLDVN